MVNKEVVAKGFTLLEIMTTIIIIGVVAAIAYPRYLTTIERFQMNEGKTLLQNLAAAQNRYKIENGNYVFNLSDLSKLDVDFRPSPKFTITGLSFDVSGDLHGGGVVDRKKGAATLYSLTIDAQTPATITCAPGTGNPSICAKLGF